MPRIITLFLSIFFMLGCINGFAADTKKYDVKLRDPERFQEHCKKEVSDGVQAYFDAYHSAKSAYKLHRLSKNLPKVTSIICDCAEKRFRAKVANYKKPVIRYFYDNMSIIAIYECSALASGTIASKYVAGKIYYLGCVQYTKSDLTNNIKGKFHDFFASNPKLLPQKQEYVKKICKCAQTKFQNALLSHKGKVKRRLIQVYGPNALNACYERVMTFLRK